MVLKEASKIIVILGPTASGKSDLAVEVAKYIETLSKSKKSKSSKLKAKSYLGGEIISADSRQVYKGLDLGSGKVPRDPNSKFQIPNSYFYRGVAHHLLDVASPKKVFTVTQFQKLGEKAIKNILKNEKIPIICGGTGLYIDSLIYDNQFPEVPPQPKLRKKLEKLSTEKLFEKLQKLDPQRAKNIDRYNPRRLIRALEIVITTGKPVPLTNTQKLKFQTLFIGTKKTTNELEKLITKRLYRRLKIGMIKEVENLHNQGLSWKRLDDLGLEYRFISRYLRGLISKSEMEDLIIKESIKYAKRQMTWFKRNPKIHWTTNKKESLCLTKNFLVK